MSTSTRSFGSFSSRASPAIVVLAALVSLPGAAFPLTEFRRANSNFDDSVDISDALFTLVFLFLGGSEPVCDDALDANDDGKIDISDALHTLGFLFLGTTEPPLPGPESPGPDPTPDELTCGIQLRCDSPADGALVDLVPGVGVPIRGTALGLFDVRVNGAPVAVGANGTFSATLDGRYGLSFVELSGTDRAGATHTALCSFLGAERWLAEGDQLDEALVTRVEPAGFAKLTSLLHLWFNANLPQRLESSFLASNPLLESDCGAFESCVTEIRYLSLSASLDPLVNIHANESQNTLNIQIQLDLRLRLRVHSKLAGIRRPAIEGEVIVDNMPVDVDVSLGVDPTTGRPLAGGQRINQIDTSAASAQFPGLEPKFIDTVLSVARDSVQERLGTDLLGGAAGLFEGLLAGTDVTLPAAGFPVGRLDGAGSVTVALEPRWTVALRNEGLTLLTGLRVVTPPPPPAATGRVPLPLAAGLEGRPTTSADVWSATHVGVFQQVLQALWRAGAFDGTVDGAALDPGLPEGTSLSVVLRAMPVVTGFDPTGRTGLDVGSLDLVITHPDLPPLLRVIAGARVRAQASLLSEDLAFGDIAADELQISTGSVALDAASRATLQGLVERIVVKLAGIALNDSFPVLPTTAVTIPPSLDAYGLTVGSRLGGAPRLVLETNHVFLEGVFGPGP